MKRSPLKPGKPPERRTRLRPRSRKQTRLGREIAAWSDAVRLRDGVCQGPARGLPYPCWGDLHAHHINRNRSDNRLENGVALCAAHHQWVHDHPAVSFELGLLKRKNTVEVDA